MTRPGLRLGLRPWPFALVAALVGLGCASGEYFSAKDARAADRLDRYLAAVMESRPIPGIGIGVVKGADLVLARAYGVQDLEKGTPVTPLTVFHTASLSKTFTATAAMQLVEEGRLDLDAPVTRYLPYFRLADGRAGEITIRHILAHLSGMPAVSKATGGTRPRPTPGPSNTTSAASATRSSPPIREGSGRTATWRTTCSAT